MSAKYSEIVQTARDYYNSEDADNFYFHVWGGEDIHIGLYANDTEAIPVASQRTVSTMAERLTNLSKDSKVIDLGAGYGGSARWLAKNVGCHVTCVNLSEVENERNREISEKAGLADLIEVHDASFEDVPTGDAEFDMVWSQDSFLHSGARDRCMQEVDRILKPGGEFIFTDPMQADDCPEGVLQPVLDRIHLSTLGSIGFYRDEASKLGWEEIGVDELTHQLVRHYSRVRQELTARRDELAGEQIVSDAYIERMIQGLGHWVEAGTKGYLAWGILHFRKPR